MNAKHTPGPWRDDPVRDNDTGDFADSRIEIRDDDGGYIARAFAHTNHGVLQANARLIAAAPDLLAALEELSDAVGSTAQATMYHYCRRVREAQEAARAAIAKARGE